MEKNLSQKIGKAVKNLGLAETIPTWNLNFAQLCKLIDSDAKPKVIIIGGNGTGKRSLLKKVAKKRATNGKQVVYAINASYKKPLLSFELKNEFKNLKAGEVKAEVKVFHAEDQINDSDENSRHRLQVLKSEDFKKHIFFDSIGDDKTLRQLLDICDKEECPETWAVLNEGDADNIKEKFPDCEVIQLDLALRNTQSITESIKKIQNSTNHLNSKMEIITQMPLGKEVKYMEREGGESYEEMLERAIKKLTFHTRGLICISDEYKPFHLEQLKSLCKKLHGRKPRTYFKEDPTVNSNKDDIKDWVTKPHKIEGKLLITDQHMVPGFQADEVIGIGEKTLDFLSNATVQFIYINEKISEIIVDDERSSTTSDNNVSSTTAWNAEIRSSSSV